jgi:NADH-ubiquinone oxidoreductase chain 4
MISLLLLIPIIGSILLLPIKENSNQLKMKQIALTTSLINFFISLFM